MIFFAKKSTLIVFAWFKIYLKTNDTKAIKLKYLIISMQKKQNNSLRSFTFLLQIINTIFVFYCLRQQSSNLKLIWIKFKV